MKRTAFLLLAGTLLVMVLAGCNAARDEKDNDLQQLAQIEIYSGSGELVNTVTDGETLQRFSEISSEDFFTDSDSEQDEMEQETSGLNVLYRIVSYKEPAAVINDGTLVKLTETTVYEDSSVIREQVALENVKIIENIAGEYLAFYGAVSEEDKEFLLSLAEI